MEPGAGTSSKAPSSGAPQCTACVGILIDTFKSKSPTCIGLRETPSTPVNVEQRDPLAQGWNGYQFVCLGSSLYSKRGPDGKALLPYCEGIEIVFATQEQAAAESAASAAAAPATSAAAAAAAGAAAAARPAMQTQQQQQAQQAQQQHALRQRQLQAAQQQRQQRPPQQQQQQQPTPAPPGARPVWRTVVDSLGGSSEDVARFGKRFQAVAARNAQSMQRHIDTAYALTVKPVIDRLSRN
ncbi:hypothetical protein Rsub_01403 [Raphidocelis subcapitata]|uniref:Uncharacterized protein n=1 Tax=Raphidocelis subcapitata TaxID=307507 RepID=A0A2V0NMZ8_9CHLO|nr:hypothetical protein Rsub_01403 [Raphidocelis subcapitata]|eukprot:GBF88904.1 hypothetical protein Rsub_01403 [Raphidocelis subcapitata]